MIGAGPTGEPVRTDTTEIGDARRRVEQLLTELPAGRRTSCAFEQPWELRAFALAVAAYHNGQYDWSEFQLALIGAIRRWEEATPEQARRGATTTTGWRRWRPCSRARACWPARELDERTAAVLANPPHRGHVARTEPVAVDPAVSPA